MQALVKGCKGCNLKRQERQIFPSSFPKCHRGHEITHTLRLVHQPTESMYLLPLRSSSQNRMGSAPNLLVRALRKSFVETTLSLGTMLASFRAPCRLQVPCSDSLWWSRFLGASLSVRAKIGGQSIQEIFGQDDIAAWLNVGVLECTLQDVYELGNVSCKITCTIVCRATTFFLKHPQFRSFRLIDATCTAWICCLMMQSDASQTTSVNSGWTIVWSQ